jgi:hypothetical protein
MAGPWDRDGKKEFRLRCREASGSEFSLPPEKNIILELLHGVR